MQHDEPPDRPTPIDTTPAATDDLPRPLAAHERSRLEAKTWNWNAVKIYRGGQGPAVSFPTYARADDPANDTVPPAPPA